MFKEPQGMLCLDGPFSSQGLLIAIGLGGISEGWLPNILLYHATGIFTFARILLIDGKTFTDRNKTRQHFHQTRNKAQERRALWSAVYPDVPLYSVGRFIDEGNISQLIPDRSVVLLSPDNHPTRALVSGHASRLETILLIMGGNDAITTDGGPDGTQGWAAVHCRINGRNITPPITQYHENVLQSEEKLPSAMSCVELAQTGQPQLLATNLFVGQAMGNLLYRYLTQPLRGAVNIVETCVNSATGEVCHYGIRERYLETLFFTAKEDVV